MTPASTIATSHISVRKIALTEDQLTNSNGCIELPFVPADVADPQGLLAIDFPSNYPLPGRSIHRRHNCVAPPQPGPDAPSYNEPEVPAPMV